MELAFITQPLTRGSPISSYAGLCPCLGVDYLFIAYTGATGGEIMWIRKYLPECFASSDVLLRPPLIQVDHSAI